MKDDTNDQPKMKLPMFGTIVLHVVVGGCGANGPLRKVGLGLLEIVAKLLFIFFDPTAKAMRTIPAKSNM